MEANPIPKGYQSITPYLTSANAALLVEFVVKAFAGIERERILRPDGSIMHTEVRIVDSLVMIGEPRGEWKPQPSMLYLYVADVDAIYLKALAAGAVSVVAPNDTFWGDRTACIKDFADNHWWTATRLENLKPEEIQKRANSFFEQKSKNTT
jgi:uncharacterized glyoxalase superfamily protein PhnB